MDGSFASARKKARQSEKPRGAKGRRSLCLHGILSYRMPTHHPEAAMIAEKAMQAYHAGATKEMGFDDL
jgi:hypothetical protein